VLSQCPVHKHETPVDAMNALKEITASVKKAEASGKIPVGELYYHPRPSWTERYESVIEKAN